MKTVLAIVCSLLLAGMLFVPVSAPAAGAGRAVCRNCRCHESGACCGTDSSSESRPVFPVPAFSTSSPQFIAFTPRQVVWTFSAAETCDVAGGCDAPAFASELPAYKRNCARLL